MASIPLHVVEHNSAIFNEMIPGDLIEIPRGKYSHWAVHVGEGKLVHLTGDNDGMGEINNVSNIGLAASGLELDKAEVMCTNFWEVVGKDKAKINNRKDRKKCPLPPSEIVGNALSKIGEQGYNILWRNCEHFVTWCRYGIPFSEQVDTFLTWAMIGTGIAAILGLMFSQSKSNKNK